MDRISEAENPKSLDFIQQNDIFEHPSVSNHSATFQLNCAPSCDSRENALIKCSPLNFDEHDKAINAQSECAISQNSDNILVVENQRCIKSSVGNSEVVGGQNHSNSLPANASRQSNLRYILENSSVHNCIQSSFSTVGNNLNENFPLTDNSKRDCTMLSKEEAIYDVQCVKPRSAGNEKSDAYNASAATNRLISQQRLEQALKRETDWQNLIDVYSGDRADLPPKKDDHEQELTDGVDEWLMGTLEHLQRKTDMSTADESYLNFEFDPDIQDEETVEVQEFLQEEEIMEVAVKDESEKSSSKEDEEPLNYDLQQGYRILKEIMGDSNRSVNWAFIHAVDATAEGCRDYYEKIKKPIWLIRMKEKFERREYENITEYVADMRLMLENCYRYNGPDHPISRKGQKLEVMMEQKLALLSRDLREKTSLAATSGKLLDPPLMGTRRQKQVVPSDSTALLNQLRWEALEKEKEAKRQQQLEKKMAYEVFLQGLQAWEDKLLEEPLRQQMKAMWELPQIGQFLLLCESALNLGDVTQYELECSLLMPRQSSALHKVMTALLSTPHQRARHLGKPSMSYRVWDEKLRQLITQWYKVHFDNGSDSRLTAVKLGLEEKFFKVVGHVNPLEKRKFHELTFYQRVLIVKSLCDFCLETQRPICEAIEAQPLRDQRESILGKDNDGNIYVHFPQFCGADLRIYRQSPQVIIAEETNQEKVFSNKSRLKRRRKHRDKHSSKKYVLDLPEPPTSCATPRIRDSRLRQNPKQIQNSQVTESSTSSESEESSSDEYEELEENDEDKKELEEEIENDKELEEEIENDKKESIMDEAPAPKVLRSLRKRPENKEKMADDSLGEVESSPGCWSSFDGSSEIIPRRSLRKIIEESKKDAIGSCSSLSLQSKDKTPTRRSSFSSTSSLSYRSGRESASSRAQSTSKAGTKSPNRRGKRKKESSSQEEDTVEEYSLPTPPSRVTRSLARSRKSEVRPETRNRSKNWNDCLNQNESPVAADIGRITRNLYRDLQESKEDITEDEDCQTDKGNAKSSRGRARKKGRRKKRCSAPVVSSQLASPCDGLSGCGVVPCDTLVVTEEDRKNVACNGHSATEPTVEIAPEEVGQGDFKRKTDDLELKKEVDEEAQSSMSLTVSLKCEPENISAESEIDNELKAMPDEKGDHEPNDNTDSSKPETKSEVMETSFNAGDKPCPAEDTEKIHENQLSKHEDAKTESVKELGDVCEIQGPEIGSFEMVVDSVEGLRLLVNKFAEKDDVASYPSSSTCQQETETSSDTYRKRCTVELHKRLTCLLQELEPYEQRLIQLNKKKRIQLRKEQENYREEPEKEQIEDIWESNDSTSIASNTNTEPTNDESSVDAESNSGKAEEKPTMESLAKSRPSRKKNTVEVPQIDEVASDALTTSLNNSVVTRKRTANTPGQQSAKKVKKGSSSTEEVTSNSGRGVEGDNTVVAMQGDSITAETASVLRNAFLKGTVGQETTKKPHSAAQLRATIASDNRGQVLDVNSLPSGNHDTSVQLNKGQNQPPRSSAALNNTTRVVGSLSGIVPNLVSALTGRLSTGAAQTTPCVSTGQILQPVVQQGLLRLTSPTGTGVQYLAVSNISQLPPSLLQQLLNSQNLLVVASSSGAQNQTLVCANAIASSAMVQGRSVVQNVGAGATSISRLQNAAQNRPPVCSHMVWQKPACQANQETLSTFQQTAKTTLAATDSNYVFSSQQTSSRMTVAVSTHSNFTVAGSVQQPSSAVTYAQSIFGQNVHNLISSEPFAGARQKYTNNLTVRALLGSRNTGEQVQGLIPTSLKTGIVTSSPISTLAIDTMVGVGHSSATSIATLCSSSQEVTSSNGEMTSEQTCSVSAGSRSNAALPLPCSVKAVSQLVVLPSVNQNSKVGDNFAMLGNPKLRLAKTESALLAPKTILSDIKTILSDVKQPQQGLQLMAQTNLGAKVIVMPKDSTVLDGGIHQPLGQVAALVSVADGSRQLVLISPQQVAALARKNIVDQAVKAAITDDISTSLPTVKFEVSSPFQTRQPPRIVTHTTTVMKAPIPALPQLTDHGLSSTSSVSQSASMLVSPTSASKGIPLMPFGSRASAASMMPAAVQLPSSAFVPNATPPSSVLGMPVLLNSALVMPAAQNIVLLQQAPMQLLSLTPKGSVMNASPVKIALSLPLSTPSRCLASSTVQVSSHCKTTVVQCLTSATPSNLISIAQRTLQTAVPSQLLPPSSVPIVQSTAAIPLMSQSVQRLTVPQMLMQQVSAAGLVVPSAKMSGAEMSTSHALASYQSALARVTYALPVLASVQRPELTSATGSQKVSSVPSSASSRPTFRIVMPSKVDVKGSQMPLVGAIRLVNRMPTELIAVGQPSDMSLQGDNRRNIAVSLHHQTSNGTSQLQGIRLLSNSCLMSGAALGSLNQTVAATVPVLLQERQTTPVSSTLSQTLPLGMNVMRLPGVQQPSAHVTSIQKPGALKLITNALTVPTSETDSRSVQQLDSQPQPFILMQDTSAPVQNLKKQMVQLAFQPNAQVPGELVQVAVQPGMHILQNIHQGKVEVQMPTASSTLGTLGPGIQIFQGTALQLPSPRKDSLGSQRSVGLSQATNLSLPVVLSDAVQPNCLGKSSDSSLAGFSSSLPMQFLAVSRHSSQAQLTASTAIKSNTYQPPGVRMNLEAAADWILQAASVVENSTAMKEHGTDSTSESASVASEASTMSLVIVNSNE